MSSSCSSSSSNSSSSRLEPGPPATCSFRWLLTYNVLFVLRAPPLLWCGSWPIQDVVWFMGFCARINTILCAPTLCLVTPPHPVIAHTIAQYNVYPRPPVIAIYTTQYWQLQYRVRANVAGASGASCLYLVHPRDAADFGAATHPDVGGGTHRRRATFERC